MKKGIYALLFLLLPGLGVHAQKKNKTAEEKSTVMTSKSEKVIVEGTNENVKVNFYKLQLSIWELNLSDYNFSLYDFKIGPHILLGKGKILISGEYSYGLGDRILPETHDNSAGDYLRDNVIFSIYKSTPSSYGQLIGTYYFLDKEVKKNLKVFITSGYGGFRTVINYYAKIPGTVVHKAGIRAGLTQGSTLYAMNDKPVYGVPLSNPSATPEEFAYPYMSDMITYTHLRVGLTYATLTNLKVLFQGYGKKQNSWLDMVYVDAIIALKNKLDDVYVGKEYSTANDKMYFEEYHIDSHTPKANIGIAIGYKSIPVSGSGYLLANAEGGLFPGLKGHSNIYAKIGAVAYIGTRAD